MFSEQTWKAVKKWLRQHWRELDLRPEIYGTDIWLFGDGCNLAFFAPQTRGAEGKLERELEKITFAHGHRREVVWRKKDNPDPPVSLEDLLGKGSIYPKEEDRKILKQQAQTRHGFAQAYAGVMRQLFPPYEHHELHSDIEDYEEALAQDKALISRLCGN